MFVAEIEGFHEPEYQKEANSVGRAIALGFFFKE
jgi:hypothetical protein